jgi:hypothetical protein
MYRNKNRKIRYEGDGKSYELFLLPENAQHIIDRASHHSHKVTLLQVMNLAQHAYWVFDKEYKTPEPHQRVFGLVVYDEKFYQVIAYLTQTPTYRCILESCHVVADNKLLRWCQTNRDLLSTVTTDASTKALRKNATRPSAR